MKIKSLCTYQAVRSLGGVETYFSAIPLSSRKVYAIEFVNDCMSFSLTAEGETIMIPMANVKQFDIWTQKDDGIIEQRNKEKAAEASPKPGRVKSLATPH